MKELLKVLKVFNGPDRMVLIEDQHGGAPVVLSDWVGRPLRVGDVVGVAVPVRRGSAEIVIARIVGVKAYVGYVRVLFEESGVPDYSRKVHHRVPLGNGRMCEVLWVR